MTEQRECGSILVVVPDDQVRAWVTTGLELGAHVPVAATGPEAGLERLLKAAVRPAVVVLRLEPDGTAAFLQRARQVDPQLGAVVIRQAGEGAGVHAAVLHGASCLEEPIEIQDLLRATAYQLHRRIERVAEAGWRRVLDAAVDERAQGLERKLEQFAAASLEMLVTALEARDPYLHGHSQRVAQLSASLTSVMGHADGEIELVRLAGRLHDIGMLSISEQVVNHDGPLTTAQRDQVQQHTVVGHKILSPYAHLSDVSRFVRGHHERWDGGGYPDGLAAEAIPWGARIIAVVEVYDAMVSHRAYRRDSLSAAEASQQIQRLAGTAFDPAVVRALASVVDGNQALEFVQDQPADPWGGARFRSSAA